MSSMKSLIGVKFNDYSKVYVYECPYGAVKIGETVIVENELHGRSEGKVVSYIGYAGEEEQAFIKSLIQRDEIKKVKGKIKEIEFDYE